MKSELNLCKMIRSDFGMTQVQFADSFAIPLRTVQGWESRKTMPVYVYVILCLLLDARAKCELYKNESSNLEKM